MEHVLITVKRREIGFPWPEAAKALSRKREYAWPQMLQVRDREEK